jgi:hypothetical protein
MKTAVEWLVEDLTRLGHNFKLYKKEIQQAKEMEKQQSINFAYEIADDLAHGVYSKKAIEDKYNETYKSE